MADKNTIIADLEKCLDDSNVAIVPADTVRTVIDLLKSKTPRLLSKEEVINNPDHVWIEFRRFKGVCVRYRDDIKFVTESKAINNYGITWRCWTQQPSESERKAVYWNDKHRRRFGDEEVKHA